MLNRTTLLITFLLLFLLLLSTKVQTLQEASSDHRVVAEFRQRQWLPAATALTGRSFVGGSALPAVKSTSPTSSFYCQLERTLGVQIYMNVTPSSEYHETIVL